MVALKAAEAERFIDRPDPTKAVVLVFGADAGLVAERVEALIAKSVDDPADPFQLARLDGDALARDPGRLSEEANTIPLFDTILISLDEALRVKAPAAVSTSPMVKLTTLATSSGVA